MQEQRRRAEREERAEPELDAASASDRPTDPLSGGTGPATVGAGWT